MPATPLLRTSHKFPGEVQGGDSTGGTPTGMLNEVSAVLPYKIKPGNNGQSSDSNNGQNSNLLPANAIMGKPLMFSGTSRQPRKIVANHSDSPEPSSIPHINPTQASTATTTGTNRGRATSPSPRQQTTQIPSTGTRQGGTGVGVESGVVPMRPINTSTHSQGLGGMSPIPSMPAATSTSSTSTPPIQGNNINNNDKPRRQPPPKVPHPYTQINPNPQQQSNLTGANQTALEVEDLGDTHSINMDQPASSSGTFSPWPTNSNLAPLVLPANRAGPSRFATAMSPPLATGGTGGTAPPPVSNSHNEKKDNVAWFDDDAL